MSEIDEMKKLIAEQRQRREAATHTVKNAADQVDRIREAERALSNRPD